MVSVKKNNEGKKEQSPSYIEIHALLSVAIYILMFTLVLINF